MHNWFLNSGNLSVKIPWRWSRKDRYMSTFWRIFFCEKLHNFKI